MASPESMDLSTYDWDTFNWDTFDWTAHRPPWYLTGRNFTDEERAEIRFYCAQDKFITAKHERIRALQAKIRCLKEEFQFDEDQIERDIRMPFSLRLWYQGLNVTRNSFVPAYTFPKFALLPLELRLRIWNFAAHVERPQVYLVNTLENDSAEALDSSTMVVESELDEHFEWIPAVLHACGESRREALKTFTYFRVGGYYRPRGAYFNTLYNNFYIGGSRWEMFKVLIQFLIEFHTTRPLDPKVLEDMEPFRKIKYLIVDHKVFEAVPIKVWTGFRSLEQLTVAISAHHEFIDEQFLLLYPDCDRPVFVKPRPNCKFGKRAAWILDHISDTFKTFANSDMPGWRIPSLRVVVKTLGDGNEEYISRVERRFREDYEDDDPNTDEEDDEDDEDEGSENRVGQVRQESNDDEEGNNEVENDEGDEDVEDDTPWFQAAKARMKHTVSPELLKGMKHKFHPRRRNFNSSLSGEGDSDRPWGAYCTDSEHESGDPASPPQHWENILDQIT